MFGGWIFMYQLFWFSHLRVSGFWLFWPIDIWAHSTSGRRYPELKITNKDGNAAVLPNLIHPNLPKTNSLRLQDGRAVDERLLESHLIKFLLRKLFRQLTQYSLPLIDIFRGLRGQLAASLAQPRPLLLTFRGRSPLHRGGQTPLDLARGFLK